MPDDALDRVRRACLALPGVSERPSHGHPAWFAGPRQLATFHAGHHADPRTTLWCAAPPGAQEAFVATDPARFFRPPYVGHRGWLGVVLEGEVDWDDVERLLGEAYREVAR